jgi:polysaccharide deacetylase family protein (PEP-CTERM system associated)
MVAEIDAAGHEVASHSYRHRLVFQLTPQEFRSDLCRSRDVLQHIIQKPVTAFRAASFSINQHSLWALDILADEGFTADSSLQPMRMKRSDIPEHGRRPFAYQLASRTLWEFPLAVHRVGNRFGVPISGGGYFRLFPLHVTTRLLRRVNARCQAPFAFYIHPWEFDPEQPRLNAGTRSQRFRHYVNLATTESKFETLLKKFRFGRMDQVLANCRSTTISA